MSPISVLWLPPDSQHDTYQFELLFSGRMWAAVGGYNFNYFYAFEDVPSDSEGLVVVCPSKYYIDKVDWLNEQIARFKYLLWVQSGNEEITIDPSLIKHPNKKIYYTTPNPAMAHLDLIDRFFGDGYAPQSEYLEDFGKEALEKATDVYFGGQVTHTRRRLAVEAIKSFRDNNKDRKVELFETAGFYQGYDDPREYYKRLASAKIAPCPSGAVSTDTFRLSESLEAGALPIADTKTPNDTDPTNYWALLFGEEPPFPLIRDDYNSLPGYIQGSLDEWPKNVNRVTAWWVKQKRRWAYELVADLDELRGDKGQNIGLVSDGKQWAIAPDQDITVVIPISPIKSHPETHILEETISTIRTHLPSAEIWLMFDGVRPEQEGLRSSYEEHIRKMLWKCLHEYKNVLPIIFDEHHHQSGMMKKVINNITTKTLLFCEQDTPLTPDCEIQWRNLIEVISGGDADVIRLHHEALVLEPHMHLMLGAPEEIAGTRLWRTKQWSQRPHLASTNYYKRILDHYFAPISRSFIEDRMFGVLEGEVDVSDITSWYGHRLWIYTPEGGNIKRSYHLDGRAGGEKFDDTQTW